MIKVRSSGVLAVLLSAAVLMGCASLGFGGPTDEELALKLLGDYEAAMAAYNADAAMALLADDYKGWRDSGKEGTVRFVDMMEERGSVLELDLTSAVVTVEGDSARVSGVVSYVGEWEWHSTYLLSRSDGGWKIRGTEREED